MFFVAYHQVSVVHAPDGTQLIETVAISVNCTTAELYTASMVMSSDNSFVHFPTGINVEASNLEDATTISAAFSANGCFLAFIFNNTDPATARGIADSITPSMSTAFDTSFTWLSTGTYETYTNVTYTGPAKSNLQSYTEWLMAQCLASGLGGFSLTFPPISQESNAAVVVSAVKESGGFDWTYSMMVGYLTSITQGSGNHVIDVLDLLNVDSLAPSSYASEVETGYSSMVMLTISSNQTVTYVSCQPALAQPPGSRGWTYYQYQPTSLMAYFSFGDDPTPVSPLTFTFSGIVVPEFTTLALLTMLILAATITIIAKKRFLK
jgi:hypothetical protein